MKKIILLLGCLILCLLIFPVSSFAASWQLASPQVSSQVRSANATDVRVLYDDQLDCDVYEITWSVQVAFNISNMPIGKAMQGRISSYYFIINVPDTTFVGLEAVDRYSLEVTEVSTTSYYGSAGVHLPIEVGNGTTGNKRFYLWSYYNDVNGYSAAGRLNIIYSIIEVKGIYYNPSGVNGFSPSSLLKVIPPCNVAPDSSDLSITNQLYYNDSQYNTIQDMAASLNSYLTQQGDTSSIDSGNQDFSSKNDEYVQQEGELLGNADSNIDKVDFEVTSLLSTHMVSMTFFMDLLDLFIENLGSFWFVFIFAFLIGFVLFILRLNK